MSGGSYDYLCHATDLADMIHKLGPLEEMSRRLAGLGYAHDAALETERLLLDLRAAEVRVQATASRLSGVWRAVEWWDSCDSSENGVGEALRKYRGQPEPPSAQP